MVGMVRLLSIEDIIESINSLSPKEHNSRSFVVRRNIEKATSFTGAIKKYIVEIYIIGNNIPTERVMIVTKNVRVTTKQEEEDGWRDISIKALHEILLNIETLRKLLENGNKSK